jgi:hypothetical protein
MLNVTLKANGCHTAEAGSALGALLLNSWQGKTFINPLYAFDGCFGTPSHASRAARAPDRNISSSLTDRDDSPSPGTSALS